MLRPVTRRKTQAPNTPTMTVPATDKAPTTQTSTSTSSASPIPWRTAPAASRHANDSVVVVMVVVVVGVVTMVVVTVVASGPAQPAVTSENRKKSGGRVGAGRAVTASHQLIPKKIY